MAVLESPQRRARKASAKKRQEARWAGKCGPVTVRFDPSVVAARAAETNSITEGGSSSGQTGQGDPSEQLANA